MSALVAGLLALWRRTVKGDRMLNELGLVVTVDLVVNQPDENETPKGDGEDE